jgi:hypothetical protein
MDNEEYQSFSRQARRHVEAEYDITRSAAVLRSIYQEVVERKVASVD